MRGWLGEESETIRLPREGMNDDLERLIVRRFGYGKRI